MTRLKKIGGERQITVETVLKNTILQIMQFPPRLLPGIAALAMLVSMTATAFAGGGSTVQTATAGELRIVAFGSSSTQGIGASTPAHSYPSMLQTDLEAALPNGIAPMVVNLGHGGDDSEEMTAKVSRVLAERPDLVIWQTGTNDPLRGLPLDRFVALTEAGLDAFRAAHVQVMLIEPQFCRALADHPEALGYRDALRRIASERALPIVRRYDLMQEWLAQGIVSETQLQSGDGLHMGDGGYALLAQYITRLIVPKAAPTPLVASR